VWTRNVDEIRDAFIGTARAMVPAVRVVVDSHVVTGAPMVIEGDGVLPAIAEDPVIAHWVVAGVVRFCCVAPDTSSELVDTMVSRGRGDHLDQADKVARQADANWAFNQWLVEESLRLSIPVVPCQPFETLSQRICSAVSGGPIPSR
jgi:2-phosphoglycerate kinase